MLRKWAGARLLNCSPNCRTSDFVADTAQTNHLSRNPHRAQSVLGKARNPSPGGRPRQRNWHRHQRKLPSWERERGTGHTSSSSSTAASSSFSREADSRRSGLAPGTFPSRATFTPARPTSRLRGEKGSQELGATFGSVQDVYSFVYFAPQGKYAENEFCKLLVAEFDGKVKPNPDEIMAVRWTTVKDFRADLLKRPEIYTPWLKLAFDGFLGSPLAKSYSQ